MEHAPKTKEKKKVIITVGCEYGCGGPALARKIAADYGIPCYDRDLIDAIIEEAGFSKDLLDKAEKAQEIRGRDVTINPVKLGAIKYHNLTDRVVFLQRETVKRLAARLVRLRRPLCRPHPALSGEVPQRIHLRAERRAPRERHEGPQPQ